MHFVGNRMYLKPFFLRKLEAILFVISHKHMILEPLTGPLVI
jgi:hypothetical protein